MKKKSRISIRIIAVLLPVVILGLAVQTYVSIIFSKQIISQEIQSKMEIQLEDQAEHIEDKLNSVSTMAVQLADMVGNSYTSLSLKEYESMLGQMIYANDMVMGSGIWFEPYAYDQAEKYVGPYVYKEGETPVVTYDYSNAEYDYFAYEFYTNVMGGETNAVFTEPYYDPTSDAVMSSCSAPIYTPDGSFIGVVTADINLETIQNVIHKIHVGQSGTAFLLNSQGQYLAHQDDHNILDQSILADPNPSLAEAARVILQQPSGYISYMENDSQMDVFYSKIGSLNWVLALVSDYQEEMRPLETLTLEMVAVAFAILIILTTTILIEITRISRQIGRVNTFATHLSKGNFTIPLLDARGKDELGAMGTSLNEMYTSNKKLITGISHHGHLLKQASVAMEQDAQILSEQFHTIRELMHSVHEDMTNAGLMTQQMSSSVEEVHDAVSILAQETVKSTELANEIRNRAVRIEAKSQQSYEQASSMGQTHEQNLNLSIRNAEVVKNVEEMAEVISNIASQINLLSLNASIEAARAGDMGRGFAVVAGEIGKLSGDTSYAVNQIKDTIHQVQKAFDDMVNSSASLLQFVQNTVTPDYDMLIEVAKQYGSDAVAIESSSRRIEEMMNGIAATIGQVGDAVGSVEASSRHTMQNGDDILHSIEEVSHVVSQVTDMSVQQESIASELAQEVANFRLE